MINKYFLVVLIVLISGCQASNQTKGDGRKVFQDRLKDGSLGPKMVVIPAGSFRMGDIQGGGYSDEQPVHRVSVGKFAMGMYEVTNAQFVKFLNAVKRRGNDSKPWFETKAEHIIFLRKLSGSMQLRLVRKLCIGGRNMILLIYI